jgi:hypothetical protein
LQHTSKASKTLETYIYNIEEGRLGLVNFSLGVGAGGTRAPPARGALVGALSSAGTGLRRTMAPPAPARRVARRQWDYGSKEREHADGTCDEQKRGVSIAGQGAHGEMIATANAEWGKRIAAWRREASFGQASGEIFLREMRKM